MSNKVLYVQENCVPCRYLEVLIRDNNLSDVVEIRQGGEHPLVNQRPTLIFGGASAIVGVLAIEKYIKTHLVQ